MQPYLYAGAGAPSPLLLPPDRFTLAEGDGAPGGATSSFRLAAGVSGERLAPTGAPSAAFFGSLSATYYAPGPRFLGRGVGGC